MSSFNVFGNNLSHTHITSRIIPHYVDNWFKRLRPYLFHTVKITSITSNIVQYRPFPSLEQHIVDVLRINTVNFSKVQ